MLLRAEQWFKRSGQGNFPVFISIVQGYGPPAALSNDSSTAKR